MTYSAPEKRKRYSREEYRGETHPHAKLTDQKVREIRQRHAEGNVNQAQLAEQYNVSKTTIKSIIRRTSWKHLD